jgi:glycogen(starch) synthase
MRILLMPSSYPPVLGGLQTAAHALARHLTARGHEILVLTNRYPRTLAAREVLEGVQVHRRLFLRPSLESLRTGRPDVLGASFYYYPAAMRYVGRLLDSFRPDVVNVHFPDGQIPFVLRMRRARIFRLVVSLHGHEILKWFGVGKDGSENGSLRAAPANKALRRLRMVLREADVVTACSKYLLDKAVELEPAVGGKGSVIYNGVDLERFEDKTPFPHSRPYVLAFGRLTYQKGFDLLLEAFARIADDQPDVDLILAGEGEERVALEMSAGSSGLAGRVLFTGRASPAEVVRLLNGCRFVVVPSRWEPFGITALEALAAGKPVMATRVGGLPEFLSDADDGALGGASAGTLTCVSRVLLVEPTAAGLSEGLRRWLAARSERESGVRANPTLGSHLSWANVTKRYLEVYGGA